MGQLFTEEMQAELERWQAIVAEARNPVDCLIPSRPKLSDTLRGFARELIGRETEKDYVERPWSPEENADFAEFVASIGVMPEDPAHAEAMQDGEVDFFNNDPFIGVKLYRA
jgi:hypothetical protein